MIRKFLNSIPEGFREWLKLFYYNFQNKDFKFSLESGGYRTKSVDGWSVLTKSPLYFVVKDIRRYEKYCSVAPGNIVIDAGANVGNLTLVYSQKVKALGKIFAFEPDKKNIGKFKEQISLNPCYENIFLEEKGLWDQNDEIFFHEAGNVGSSVFPSNKTAFKKKIKVITIDDFVRNQNLQKLDFVKMDIEGAEIQAIIGAKATIKQMRPNFAIASYHVVDDVQTYKKVESIFRLLKYPFHTEFFSDGEIITYAGPMLNDKFRNGLKTGSLQRNKLDFL